MGPALKEQTLNLIGAKGGVGCSLLTAITAITLSQKNGNKIAVIDGTPFSRSLLFSYLPIPTPSHYLHQLAPYADHLNHQILEKYFISEKGLTYIPISKNYSENFNDSEVFKLIKKISKFSDYTLIDLSSIPEKFHSKSLEIGNRNIIIISAEHSALISLKNVEKMLADDHFKIDNFGFLLNQSHAGQTIPKDPSMLSPHLSFLGTVPFLGEEIAIDLFEKRASQKTNEKQFTDITRMITAALSAATSSKELEAEQTSPVSTGQPPSLHTVHDLHQQLLEKLRKSGSLQENSKGILFQRQLLEPQAKEILNGIIQEMDVADRSLRQQLVIEVLDLAFGLGPLEKLLSDQEITEIMVNGPHQIFVEKNGKLRKSEVQFLDDLQLRTAIERILAPIGRRLDESQPYVDGRLLDGSRVNAVIPPISLNGPTLTIRKFSKNKLAVQDLIRFGSLTQDAAQFLGACVKARKNIVVSGGTGSGKTTLLNILSNFIPADERIVTIEDSAELQLGQEHVVRLESRPANLEGTGRITIRDLVINALRMRPDRIVVGECRGGEALDMLQAMNTGHDGSMTTAHANTSRDALARLETMCLFAGVELPLKAIREQISRAVDLIVQQSRLPNGKRTITQISEVQGMEGDVIVLQDIFVYDKEQGLIRQPFTPSFIKSLSAVGYQWTESN